MSAQEQAQAIQQLRQQVAEQAQRDLMTKMTEKCFHKCTNLKNMGVLDRSEQKCVALCVDRYADCIQAVNEALVARQQSRS